MVFRYAQRQKLRAPFRSTFDAHFLLTVVCTADEVRPLIAYAHQTFEAVLVPSEESPVRPWYPEAIGGCNRELRRVVGSELKRPSTTATVISYDQSLS